MGRIVYSEKIVPACKYCVNVINENGASYCAKKKNIEVDPDGKCFRYKYNVLERIPEVIPDLPKYEAKDFSIE